VVGGDPPHPGWQLPHKVHVDAQQRVA
jgi:hypothetical protein